MNTDVKGQIAVLKIQERALQKGIISCVPIVPARYDLIMDIAGKLTRIQCKYANGLPTNSTGAILVRTASTPFRKKTGTKHHPYSEDEIDLILSYIPAKDVVIMIKPEMFKNKTAITFRITKPINNQIKNINLLDDFIW